MEPPWKVHIAWKKDQRRVKEGWERAMVTVVYGLMDRVPRFERGDSRFDS
jgi:hypothetical protein